MTRKTTRRRFVKQIAVASLTMPLAGPALVRAAASDKINLACVGVGGKGASDLAETSYGQNVVAICDIDENRLASAAEKFPKAKKYTDWRKLLEQKDIDAVTVSTPDHTHAPVSISAMSLGKHVYTQKPLTHSVYEARRMTELAKESGVVTQMGIQHHATARLKDSVDIVQSGIIGKVKEVHTWTDRPGNFWKQDLTRPKVKDPVPSHVHWDQWLGTAPARPYVNGMYHSFHWRGWWDFGTGALGDMGCHLIDPIVNALQLGPPKTIWAEGPKPNPESGPLWCIVHYDFAATQYAVEGVKLHWYEAGKQPPREIFQAPKDWKGSKNGVLYIGEKGNLFVGFPETAELFPVEKFADYEMPQNQSHNHYRQWTAAILGKDKTSCPFSYSGPLTETVLLGNVAYRSGKKITWDSKNLKATGAPQADAFLRRSYRKGWEVEGLS